MLKRGFKASSERWASRLRASLSLEDHERLPARRLAVHLQVLVWSIEQIPGLPSETLHHLTTVDPQCWSAVTVHEGNRDLIIVNSAHSDVRQESSVMHELAHVVLRHRPARVDVSEDGAMLLSTFDAEQEEEANWLGAALLLPRALLVSALRRGMTIEAIQREFLVSEELLNWRLNGTGVKLQMRRAGRGHKKARGT